MTNDLSLLADLVSLAQKKGASAADAVMFSSTSLSVTVRLGKTEGVERSEAREIGLRVFKGQKQGVISTSDLRSDKLEALVDRVIGMAESTPDDQFAGLAAPEQLCTTQPKLDLCDPQEPAPEHLLKLAGDCEAAALAVEGISNSEGGSADWARTDIAMLASNGFSGSYARSHAGVSTVVLAGSGTAMERDYDYDSAVYLSDLRDAAEIGRKAGERTMRRLNPRTVSSQQVPVIFDSRQSRGILSAFLSAINGGVVARGATFLKDKMGQGVFNSSVTIMEDPFVLRGRGSRPFDGEGLTPQRRTLIDQGILTGWLLDLRSARQLGLAPTGNAARGLSSPPSASTSNVWIENGKASVDELIADIRQGFFVTDLLGHGSNLVTGDYSRGASGYWIENGKLAYPVSGLTIAGNLGEMFRATTPANNLQRRFGTDAPTLRIDGMAVAGQ